MRHSLFDLSVEKERRLTAGAFGDVAQDVCGGVRLSYKRILAQVSAFLL